MTEGTDAGSRSVFCGNLSFQVGWQELKEFFKNSEVGESFEHAEVLQYKDGRKTGHGIVRFADADAAQKAIDTMADKVLKGREIFLRLDQKGGKGPGSKGKGKQLSEDSAAAQVYVGNLSYYTSWQNLKDHMVSAGEVEYCDILKSKDGRSAGAGLVRYKNPDDAKKAIEELNDTELDGRAVFVREDREGRYIEGKSSSKGKGKKGSKGKGKKAGRKSEDREGEVAVHIAGFKETVTWKDLKDEFSKYEPSHTEIKAGKAIIKFKDEEAADAFVDQMWKKSALGNDNMEPEVVAY
ncbi:unnamed protein product [Amoebophrya sp. A120]|nr:unnamed protein product [Amoebophrya sp. A120]|eukprot:GSA120T00021834001.1